MERAELLKSGGVEPPPMTPFALVQMALDKGVTADVLDKLLSVQQRWEADKARKAFDQALAAFKAECPSVVSKTGTVDFQSAKGRTSYNYTPLSEVLDLVTPLLAKHGLNLSWKSDQGQGTVTVTCWLRHALGHSESTPLTGPLDTSGNKNPIQAIGSTLTYLQRYTAIELLGLATRELDNDGHDDRQAKEQPTGRVTVSNANRPAEDVQRVSGILKDVLVKEGKSANGRPWKKWGVQIDGRTYGTFDKDISVCAEKLYGKPVIAYVERKGKLWTLLQLEATESAS